MNLKLFLQRDLFFLVSLAFVSFLSRFPFRLRWLEDWDSVQFALGMHQFSVIDHQPHPPGYPLYIILGKLFYLFFQSDVLALTFLSSFLGSLAVIPLFILTRKMFDKKTAILASLLFITMPVTWVMSVIPVSNISGLFFLITFNCLICFWGERRDRVPVIGLFAGIILGVRFTDFPIVFGLMGLLTLKAVVTRRDLLYPLVLSVTFLVGLLLWLIPTILISGSNAYFQANSEISSYVLWHDVSLGKSLPLPEWFLTRLSFFWTLLQKGYTLFLLVLAAMLIIPKIVKINVWREFRYQVLFIWLISYGVMLAFYYNLELPQYTLPLAPPLAILVASVLSRLSIRKTYGYLVTPVLILTVAITSNYALSQIGGQTRRVPVTIAPVLYLKENFTPENTTLLTTFLYRQFQYYAPEYKNYYISKIKPDVIETEFVVIDYKGLKDQVPALEGYEIIDRKQYSHKELVFPRLNETEIYILKRVVKNPE